MIKLSVVIVNYNVKHFIEQCLISVYKAISAIQAEVFVTDNNSVDGSVAMIREKFPQVKLIENKKNYGFSYANNQAIKQATGEYILLLNPDTVVEEDTFLKCIRFMDSHPEAGALGVKMIDGKGRFLPESKRALPTPIVAFYKIFGLSRLFPHSKTFGRYHLGHLDKNQTHEVEILPGAFMFIRKECMDKTGLLDEDYFMYGEDIDLSYRIIKSGYKNYYYPETAIIHYKGESTKKGSMNYVYVFYNAMIIFARKHFTSKNASLFAALIHMAIYFRAFIALINRFVKQTVLPVLDFISIFTAYHFIKPLWEQFKFQGQGAYPDSFMKFAVPAYILVWMASLWFYNAYAKNFRFSNILKGILSGTAIILILYALLPESFRFSRALILIGTVFSIVLTSVNRLLIHLIPFFPHKFKTNRKLRIAVVGLIDEINRVSKIINLAEFKPQITALVSPSAESKESYHMGDLSQLNEIIKIHKIDELVFCAKDISSNQIIHKMLELSYTDIDFKIAQPDSWSVIGSNSIETAGELYTIEINAISKDQNIRFKRTFDIISSLIILLFSPFILILSKISVNLINNCLNVLLGFKTWVGYFRSKGINTEHLPKLKDGVLNPLDLISEMEHTTDFVKNCNTVYAKNFTVWNDLKILIKGFKYTDRK